MVERNALKALLFFCIICTTSAGLAKDFEYFDLEMKFHVAVPDSNYTSVVNWLKQNIKTAENLYSNRPRLWITLIF